MWALPRGSCSIICPIPCASSKLRMTLVIWTQRVRNWYMWITTWKFSFTLKGVQRSLFVFFAFYYIFLFLIYRIQFYTIFVEVLGNIRTYIFFVDLFRFFSPFTHLHSTQQTVRDIRALFFFVSKDRREERGAIALPRTNMKFTIFITFASVFTFILKNRAWMVWE